MMSIVSDTVWRLSDCIFPRLKPLNRVELNREETRHKKEIEEIEARVAAISSDEQLLREYLDAASRALDLERTRRQSVDARLTSIIGLCSIAATLVFGGLIAQVSGPLSTQPTLSKSVLVLGSLYLTLQLCISLWAAARGVSRFSYSVDTPSELLPSPGIAISVFLRRRINQVLKTLDEHRSVNNRKVSQMAVAHRAMFNFLVGLLLFACAAAYFAMYRNLEGWPGTDRVMGINTMSMGTDSGIDMVRSL